MFLKFIHVKNINLGNKHFIIYVLIFFTFFNTEVYAKRLTRKNYLVCYWNLLYDKNFPKDNKLIFNLKDEEFKTTLIKKCGQSPFERDKKKIYLKLKNNKLIRY